jgi:hypothetical protein
MTIPAIGRRRPRGRRCRLNGRVSPRRRRRHLPVEEAVARAPAADVLANLPVQVDTRVSVRINRGRLRAPNGDVLRTCGPAKATSCRPASPTASPTR